MYFLSLSPIYFFSILSAFSLYSHIHFPLPFSSSFLERVVQAISTVVPGVNPDWRLLFRLRVTKPKIHMHFSSAKSLLVDSLLGFWAFSDFLPQIQCPEAPQVLLEELCVCGGNTHEAPLQLLVLLLLHMAQMCTSSFSSLYLSAVLLGHTKDFRGGM